MTTATIKVTCEIEDERRAQDAKWGKQDHPQYPVMTGGEWAEMASIRDEMRMDCDNAARDGTLTWNHILFEEMAEAIAEPGWPKRRAELIQTAAVIVAAIENGDERDAAQREIKFNSEVDARIIRLGYDSEGRWTGAEDDDALGRDCAA